MNTQCASPISRGRTLAANVRLAVAAAAISLAAGAWAPRVEAQPRYYFALFPMEESFSGTSLSEVDDLITGASWTGSDFAPVLWSPQGGGGGGGGVEFLPTLGDPAGVAAAINDGGNVVGSISNPISGTTRAVLWRGGIEAIVLPSGAKRGDAEALAINNAGEIVGVDLGVGSIAAVWRNGQPATPLETPDNHTSEARAINESGEIVGFDSEAFPPYTERAILWSGAKRIDLGTLRPENDGSSQAVDINDLGEVIGLASDSAGEMSPFIWRDGVMTPLGAWGGYLVRPLAINDRSFVVGLAQSKGSRAGYGFIWGERTGFVRLQSLLPAAPQTRIGSAIDITDDSRVLVIIEDWRFNERRGYYAVLVPVTHEFALDEPAPGLAGVENTFSASGLTPGAEVTFVYGLRGGGAEVNGCDRRETALQIDQPVTFGSAIADNAGVATITAFVPARARGAIVVFQAMVESECRVSAPIEFSFE